MTISWALRYNLLKLMRSQTKQTTDSVATFAWNTGVFSLSVLYVLTLVC